MKKCFLKIGFMVAVVAVTVAVFDVSSVSSSDTAWLTRCDKDEAGNSTHCEMYSRLNLQDTKRRVAEFAIGYHQENSDVANGIIVLPLGILVQEDVVFFIDDKAYFNAKVGYCLEDGCYTHVSLPEQTISNMKKGNEAALVFKARNGKSLKVKMPLTGFTKTIRELSKK